MRTLAVYNVKGGVGKTASAVNLAYLAAREGARTLLWDLDPQGASTFTFRVQPKIEGGTRALFLGRSDVGRSIRASDYPNLDILPADFSNRKVDGILAETPSPNGSFRRLLERLADEYDLVLLDCAPNASQIAESVFSGVDALLIPTIPTTLSLRTLAQLMKHLKRRQKHRPHTLPFFCMVDRRKALHRKICDWVAEHELGFVEARIPYSSDVEQMGTRRAPLFDFAKRGPAAKAYEALWHEVLGRLESQAGPSPLYRKSKRRAIEAAVRAGTALRPRD